MQSEKMLEKMKKEWEMLQKGDPNALDDAIKAQLGLLQTTQQMEDKIKAKA